MQLLNDAQGFAELLFGMAHTHHIVYRVHTHTPTRHIVYQVHPHTPSRHTVYRVHTHAQVKHISQLYRRVQGVHARIPATHRTWGTS